MATTCVPHLLLVLLLCCTCEGIFTGQEYNEGLNLKHLPDGRVLALFEHVIQWDIDPVTLSEDNTVRHYGIFPKALAEIVGYYSVQELHLTLTKGKWRTSQWGYPPVSTPPGTEFWVWFLPNTTNVDHQWKGLINGISGLTCTSLSSIDSSSTYVPPMSFRPHGAILGNLSSSFLRYAALPREPVCTENLTPWSKLLPCGQKAGIGSLYSALKLYDSEFISLSLHLKPICQDSDCVNVVTELYQSLTVVFKPTRKDNKLKWSFSSLFTRTLTSHCSLANNPQITIDITELQGHDYSLTPPPDNNTSQTVYGRTSTLALYSVHNHTDLDVSLSWNDYVNQLPISPPHLHVLRYVTGSGLERGGIVTEITNYDQTTPLTVLLLEMVPWYFRVLLHTMKSECFQLDIGNIHEFMYNIKCDKDPVISRHFSPAKDRLRPYTTELLLSIPPSSHVILSVQFLRSFLKWNEYPPDANHGFYINSAVLTAAIPKCSNCSFPVSAITNTITDPSSAHLLRIHTEPLLVLLPSPDFSMPYNVICFVSTVVAIGFGSIFNLTTKSLQPEDPLRKSLLSRVLLFIKSKLRKNNDNTNNSDKKIN